MSRAGSSLFLQCQIFESFYICFFICKLLSFQCCPLNHIWDVILGICCNSSLGPYLRIVCLVLYGKFLNRNIHLSLPHVWLMEPHSSTLAWKTPWMEEPGRLQSMGSLRVRHDWATSLSLFTFMHWRRKWQPTPVFLPRESQGRGSLVGCGLWGHTESDTTEVT